jgi:[ribosomal protein S5]-alanine N-acetyltransferase
MHLPYLVRDLIDLPRPMHPLHATNPTLDLGRLENITTFAAMRLALSYPDGQVGLSPLTDTDRLPFMDLVTNSTAYHHPWIQPAATPAAFDALLARSQGDAFQALAVWANDPCQIVGMIHLSQIYRGAFESGYLSYWVSEAFQQRGWMTEAMRLTLHYAFNELGLHRLEANIQPANALSIKLVARVGFVKEGYSAKYLKVLGEWRDHERWAIHHEIWNERGLAAAMCPQWKPLPA